MKSKQLGRLRAEPQHFEAVLAKLYEEASFFRILPVDDSAIVAAITLIIKHSLNSADAIHLASAHSGTAGPGDKTVLVTCDKRLQAAGRKEKLRTLNPETDVEPKD